MYSFCTSFLKMFFFSQINRLLLLLLLLYMSDLLIQIKAKRSARRTQLQTSNYRGTFQLVILRVAYPWQCLRSIFAIKVRRHSMHLMKIVATRKNRLNVEQLQRFYCVIPYLTKLLAAKIHSDVTC